MDCQSREIFTIDFKSEKLSLLINVFCDLLLSVCNASCSTSQEEMLVKTAQEGKKTLSFKLPRMGILTRKCLLQMCL